MRYSTEFPFYFGESPFPGTFQSSIPDRLISASATQLSPWSFTESGFQLGPLIAVTDWIQVWFFLGGVFFSLCSPATNYECYQRDLKEQKACSRAELSV